MPRTSIVRVAFNAGIVDPKVDARADLAKGAVALRSCTNFVVESYGRAVRRAGTRFIAQARTEDVTARYYHRSRAVKYRSPLGPLHSPRSAPSRSVLAAR